MSETQNYEGVKNNESESVATGSLTQAEPKGSVLNEHLMMEVSQSWSLPKFHGLFAICFNEGIHLCCESTVFSVNVFYSLS